MTYVIVTTVEDYSDLGGYGPFFFGIADTGEHATAPANCALTLSAHVKFARKVKIKAGVECGNWESIRLGPSKVIHIRKDDPRIKQENPS